MVSGREKGCQEAACVARKTAEAKRGYFCRTGEGTKRRSERVAPRGGGTRGGGEMSGVSSVEAETGEAGGLKKREKASRARKTDNRYGRRPNG